MNEQLLVDSLASSCAGKVPAQVDIVGIKQFTQDELHARTRQLLSLVSQHDDCSRERGDWVRQADRTLVRLAQGARAVLYHASGALQYSSGLAPLEAGFAKVEDKEVLTRLVSASAEKLRIGDWAGDQGSIAFERLWQVKGQGADQQNVLSAVSLFRVVGAYRHSVAGIPVLGHASVAIKLAGEGQLDALSLQVRPSASEVLDKARTIEPDLAARQIAAQLASVLGQSKGKLPGDVVESQTMQFGYLNLGKRKAQRVLAPAFVAQVVLRHEFERQAYIFAVAATEKSYLPLSLYGNEAVVRDRATAAKGCHDVLR